MAEEPIYKGQLPWKDNIDPVSETNPFHTKDASANAKLEQIKTLLGAGATDAGLAALKAVMDILAAKDFSTSAKQDLIKGVLDTLSAKDFATQTTLASLALDIADMKTDIDAVKTAMTDGTQKVQQTGTITALYSMSLSDRPYYGDITEPTIFFLMNSDMDAWWTDGSEDWEVI